MVEVKIPEVGESIVEVQIGEWLKAEGDPVRKDDSLAVIESEKTNFELPAPASGKLARILSQAGQTVKVGATVAQIESGGDGSPPAGAPSPRARAGNRETAGPAPARPERSQTGGSTQTRSACNPGFKDTASSEQAKPASARTRGRAARRNAQC